MPDDITFESVLPSEPEAETLMAMLDAEITAIYQGRSFTGSLRPEEKTAFNGVFIIARRGDVPVACGAVRILDGETGEVKRVYATPEERGSGTARALMATLERVAAERGLSRLVLETGDRQRRAIRFYEALGYTWIPPFGEHIGKQWVCCYEKHLS